MGTELIANACSGEKGPEEAVQDLTALGWTPVSSSGQGQGMGWEVWAFEHLPIWTVPAGLWDHPLHLPRALS